MQILHRLKENLVSFDVKETTLASFLALVFSIPRVLPEIKLVLLLVLLISIAFGRTFRFPKNSIVIPYFIIIFPSILIAILLNNDIRLSLNSLKLNFAFPLLLYFIFLNFEKEVLFRVLIYAGLLSLVLSFLINTSTLLYFLNFFPVNFNDFFYPDENRIGFNDGFVHMVNSSFSYWIYTIPLYFCRDSVKSKQTFVFLFFTFLLAIFSGRRILMLPYLFVLCFNLKSIKKVILVFISVILVFFILVNLNYFDFGVILDRFGDAISGEGDSEARSEQHKYFWIYIFERPFFGYGMGSFMPNYLRSDTFKTAYENTYDYLFFERGLLAGLLFFLFLSKLFFNVLFKYKNEYLSLLIATGALLLASYTNPYWLSSFDYTIPFAVLMRFADSR